MPHLDPPIDYDLADTDAWQDGVKGICESGSCAAPSSRFTVQEVLPQKTGFQVSNGDYPCRIKTFVKLYNSYGSQGEQLAEQTLVLCATHAFNLSNTHIKEMVHTAEYFDELEGLI